MLEPATYEAGEVDFPAGTVCLFYTDGLVERANRADEFFGEDRVLATLRRMSGAPSGEVVAAVVADADRFARAVEPGDDIALLLVRSC
jgi:serine phosphatase RsbU (regulator of sigma subunit)